MLLSWLKAKFILLVIAIVWGYLILVMAPIQIPVTMLGTLKRFKRYRWAFYIAQDQAVNAILGGNPDVTVSSKVGYMAEQGSKTAKAMAVVIDFLFYVAVGQKDHCAESIERDEEHY